MKTKTIKRLVTGIFVIPILLFGTVLLIIWANQDALVQKQIAVLNKGYKGQIAVGDVHLAPFKNFPYISLKIDDVRIAEDKTDSATTILDVADIYAGVNFWDMIRGKLDIQSLLVEDGVFNIVLHPDGTTNLQNALATPTKKEASGENEPDIHLKRIELRNLDIHQLQESTNLDVETLIYFANGGFQINDTAISAHIDSEFQLNVIKAGDTTYFKHKHFEFHTDLSFNKTSGLLAFEPSGITMEHGDFQLEGTIDTKNEMDLDLVVTGTKPNFNMFIAFAPSELIPVLERYENAGNIYFNAHVKGPVQEGTQPRINAAFGASEAFLENTQVRKRIDDMGFSGYFTNGEARSFETMEFGMTDIRANLEEGNFVGNIVVKNFKSPDIDMELEADFDIPFIVGFLNLTEIEDPAGSVEMKLRFHDIIDLDNPAKALEDLNQAYFAELKVSDLAFKSPDLPNTLHDLNIHLEMNGKQADLDQFDLELGNTDLSITGYLSDLPAIVHHTPSPVRAHLEIRSKVFDIAGLTNYSAEDSTGVNERIENLSLAFSFNALGKAFTEYTHLPVGEFFIDDLYADLKNYPHTLHDFHADVFVKDDDLKIVDFTGNIDDSDFHFNGLIEDYSFWMEDMLNGDVALDLTLKSDLLRFENLFTYEGENFVPPDYRHEEVRGLELRLATDMHYKNNVLHSIDVDLEQLAGKMKIHPLKFENFSGHLFYEDKHVQVKDFTGKMGRTEFVMDLNYFMGENDSVKMRDNTFTLTSDFIDFDALSAYNPPPSAPKADATKAEKTKTTADVSVHADAYNIYELPFPDLQLEVDIGHFIYHRLDLAAIKGQLRTTKNHYLYLDTLSMQAAGGEIALSGYFNGSDSDHIYLKPNMHVSNVDLDKLLFKFENFGQDAVVSENLHGKLTAKITGNIRVYPDLVPDLDHSEVHLDVLVLNGRLENYGPILLLSDYMGDKDLTSIRFDTLQNHMDLTQGTITIPNMTIESTLGHMDISGTQDINNNIDYYVRIPWSLVKKAARNRLFGTKARDENAVDEIIEVDKTKKTRYLNVNITGTFDDYKIRIKKKK
jgi:hypothetical protein